MFGVVVFADTDINIERIVNKLNQSEVALLDFFITMPTTRCSCWSMIDCVYTHMFYLFIRLLFSSVSTFATLADFLGSTLLERDLALVLTVFTVLTAFTVFTVLALALALVLADRGLVLSDLTDLTALTTLTDQVQFEVQPATTYIGHAYCHH